MTDLRNGKQVAIVGYGAYIPVYRIKLDEIAKVWGDDPEVIKRGLRGEIMSKPTSSRIWRLAEKRYRLIGVECSKCGKRYIGSRKICPICHSRELKNVELSRKGKIYSYTVIRVLPKERENYGPYVIAIIELDDGCRLTAEIVDCSPEEVKIGMPVELTFRKVGEESETGIIYYGYKFRPLID